MEFTFYQRVKVIIALCAKRRRENSFEQFNFYYYYYISFSLSHNHTHDAFEIFYYSHCCKKNVCRVEVKKFIVCLKRFVRSPQGSLRLHAASHWMLETLGQLEDSLSPLRKQLQESSLVWQSLSCLSCRWLRFLIKWHLLYDKRECCCWDKRCRIASSLDLLL